jgi:hypothetical protein
MQYIGELTGDQIINMIDEEIKLIDYTGDITLTNTTTKKTLIITTKNQPLIIIPKKPTQFLDLPVEIRQIIKNFAFNDNTKEMKDIFKNEYTNISNMVLLKNMFGEFPKELILNNNRFVIRRNDEWEQINKLSIKFKNHVIKNLNNSNLFKHNLEYSNINIYLHARLYNDLNFDFIIWTSPKFANNKKYNDYYKYNPHIYHYIDKQGNIYDKYNYLSFDINDIIGSIKYKDMYEIINDIKNIVYNS